MDKRYKAEVIALMEQAYRQGYQDSMLDTGNPGLHSVDFADYVTRKGKRIVELMTQTIFTGQQERSI